MSITLQQINSGANSDTWGVLVTRLNQVINAIATQVLTSEANSSGGVTTGNTHLNGVYSATQIATNTLRGGNVATSKTLTISSNVVIATGNTVTVGNSTVNTSITEDAITANNATFNNLTVSSFTINQAIGFGRTQISQITGTTTGTGSQIFDAFALTDYRSMEYVVSTKDNTANGYQVTKILLLHDGVNVYTSEYGTMASNSSITLSTFSGSANATHAILNVTPGTSNTSLVAVRTALGV